MEASFVAYEVKEKGGNYGVGKSAEVVTVDFR